MSVERIFSQEIGRRNLLAAGLGGLAILSGCAGSQKDVKDPSNFNLGKFVGWYKRNKLYNRANPNLRRPHSAHNIFVDSFNRWTPGVDYYVPAGEIMVAAAPGQVADIGEITGTGRAGGMYVRVSHPKEGRYALGSFYPPFDSYYNHVAEPLVKLGQMVSRGEPLCRVPAIYCEIAKLYLKEVVNHIDPDNYGMNHSYMNYHTNNLQITETDKENVANPKLMDERVAKQKELLTKLDKFRLGGYTEDNLLVNLWHNKGGYKQSQWSTIEKFRFLEILYQMHPHQFPTLGREEFKGMRKEFYQNQPIILTLPFAKK